MRGAELSVWKRVSPAVCDEGNFMAVGVRGLVGGGEEERVRSQGMDDVVRVTWKGQTGFVDLEEKDVGDGREQFVWRWGGCSYDKECVNRR